MSRRVFLSWVLDQCDLSGPERAAIKSLLAQQPPGPEYPTVQAPTMMFQLAVADIVDLGPCRTDGHVRMVLHEDRAYVSVMDFGWVPMTLEDPDG